MTRDTAVAQRPMEPEAVAPGLGATHDRRVRRQAKADLGRCDLGVELPEVARRHRAQPRRVGNAGREGEFPRPVAEVEREVQRTQGCSERVVTVDMSPPGVRDQRSNYSGGPFDRPPTALIVSDAVDEPMTENP